MAGSTKKIRTRTTLSDRIFMPFQAFASNPSLQLASALGPMTLRFVYHFTKDGAFVGPGSMFIFAAGLYAVAVYIAYLLPVRKTAVGASGPNRWRIP